MVDALVVAGNTIEALIGLLSLLGNALVLYVIARHRSLRTSTNFLIANLAAADLLVGLVGIPFVIINNFGYPHNFYGCLFMNSIIVVLTQISIFSLVCIALERFLAVCTPVFHRHHVNGRSQAAAIAISWIAGVIVGLVPMFGWNLGWPEDNICVFVLVISMEYMVYFNFLGFVLVPLIIIFVTYGFIFYVIKKRSVKVGDTNPANMAKRVQMNKESKAARRIFSVIVLFAVCWLPIHIMNCITLWANRTYFPVLLVGIWLSHANSAMNPFLYAYTNSKFKLAFMKTLRMKGAESVDVDATATVESLAS